MLSRLQFVELTPFQLLGYVFSGCRFALGSFMAISTVSLEYCRYQTQQRQEAARATMDALNR